MTRAAEPDPRRGTVRAAPHKLVVMGVAGSGKSTLAQALAQRLDWRMVEGDALHTPESRVKMRQAIALTDRDREPWLDRLAEIMAAHYGDVVLACSALKRAYRDRLRRRVPDLGFVFIEIAAQRALDRVAARQGHEFPASLVASQFDALEPPNGEPRVLRVAATLTTEAQIDAVVRWLTDPTRNASDRLEAES